MKIAPSILTANFTQLNTEIASVSASDYLHIDVMDGHFVPNISFGPAIVKQISTLSNCPLDVHLMVSNPLFWIDKFSFTNTEFITVHVESNDYSQALEAIKKAGIKAGISIKPNTSIEAIKHLLKDIDMVLVMSVEPGFGGQSFLTSALDKIKTLDSLRKEFNYTYVIEVDGGINFETAQLVKDAGVDIAVVGSYLFNQKDRNHTIKKLK